MNHLANEGTIARSLAMDLQQHDHGLEFVQEYWKILRAHRLVVLGVLAGVVALALVLTLLTTPIYRALSTIQIKPDTIKVVKSEGVTSADAAYDRDYYQTQYELLRSRALALR